MKFRIVRQFDRNPARSPFRIVEQETSREIDWANRFLDRECIRRVAENLALRLRALPAALCPLVGKRSSHHRRNRRRSHRIHAARLCALSIQPRSTAVWLHHQFARCRC